MQMPVWEIEGVHFFSVVGKETRKLRFEGNYQIYMKGPDFYSLTDMLVDHRVRNYANYLADGRHWWTAVRGWWNGWDW